MSAAADIFMHESRLLRAAALAQSPPVFANRPAPFVRRAFCSYRLGCQMSVHPCVQARHPHSRLATLSDKQKCLLAQTSSCMKADCSVLPHSRTRRPYSQIALLPLFTGLFAHTGLVAKCLCVRACKHAIRTAAWQHFHKYIEKNYRMAVFHCLFKLDSSCLIW